MNGEFKTWVAYDNLYLWAERKTEEAAKAVAARFPNAAVKGFKFVEGDEVKSRLGEILTVIRPATSVTGAFGYKVSGGKWEFYSEDDVVAIGQ